MLTFGFCLPPAARNMPLQSALLHALMQIKLRNITAPTDQKQQPTNKHKQKKQTKQPTIKGLNYNDRALVLLFED